MQRTNLLARFSPARYIARMPKNDLHFMRLALAQAQQAAAIGEVPVGAVVVDSGGAVLGSGFNQPIRSHDPCAHAEILALRAAAQKIGNERLAQCSLYVSLEPCAMCAGAIQHARIARLIFAAPNPKNGAAGSVLDLFVPQLGLNAHTAVEGGLCAAESARLLSAFFARQRTAK